MTAAVIRYQRGRPEAVAPTGSSYGIVYGKVYNATAFGLATGASATTNVAAVLAAAQEASAAGGGTVDIPAGTYDWKVPSLGDTTGCFAVSSMAKVTIRGAGRYQTTLRDPQAAAVSENNTGNANSANAFFTFTDCTDITCKDFGLTGALVYGSASLQGVHVDVTRKGFYFHGSSSGCKNCHCENIYFTRIEGECWLVDGTAVASAVNCTVRNSFFSKILSNCVNINTPALGSFNCGGWDLYVDDVGNGNILLAGGTNVQFHDVHVRNPSAIGTGAEAIVISDCNGADIRNCEFDGLNLIASAPLVSIGYPTAVDHAKNVRLRDIKFKNCKLLGLASNTASIIAIKTNAKNVEDVFVDRIECDGVDETDHVGFPDIVFCRVSGSNTVSGHIGTCTVRNGSAVNPPTIGVRIEAGVTASGLAVKEQNFPTTVTAPYTYTVEPLKRHDYNATATWDPPNVNAGAQTTTTITVAGASLGDPVVVGFSLDLQGMQLTGYVSASNTVTVVLRNGTAGALDLAAGTLKARALKLP
jgi:hypothetical protein